MQQHGPWKIRKTDDIYSDPFICVTRDDVIRPDGKDGTHVKVFMKPGVSVLPVDEDGNVFLTSEFHYAIGRVSLEVVSGGIDPGEAPLETAQRELREEVGLLADSWTELGEVDPFTTIIESPTRLYLATNLRPTETDQEGTEQIETVRIPFQDALKQVMDGRISHAPSCVAILKTNFLITQARLDLRI